MSLFQTFFRFRQFTKPFPDSMLPAMAERHEMETQV